MFAQLVWFEMLSNAKFDNDLLWKQKLREKREVCVNKDYGGFGVHFHNASTSIYRKNVRIGVSISTLGCKWLKG